MIVSKLQGGLGNQMFQYAAGLSLSLKYKTELYFDPSFFTIQHGGDDIASREFELNIFDVQTKFVENKTLRKFLHPGILQRFFNKTGISKKTIFRERSLRFDDTINQLAPPLYIEGFWPSELYFSKFESAVRKAFTLTKKLNDRSQQLSDEMKVRENAVSVHVRRGDYVSSERTNQIHGTCSASYYLKSMALLKKQLESPHFYFFSDDTNWVKSNLLESVDDYTLVEHNRGSDSWQDMILMSNCHHHIIANSTFSWWGAWLNPSNQKKVIAPENWFKTTSDFFDARDIIPSRWTKISNE